MPGFPAWLSSLARGAPAVEAIAASTGAGGLSTPRQPATAVVLSAAGTSHRHLLQDRSSQRVTVDRASHPTHRSAARRPSAFLLLRGAGPGAQGLQALGSGAPQGHVLARGCWALCGEPGSKGSGAGGPASPAPRLWPLGPPCHFLSLEKWVPGTGNAGAGAGAGAPPGGSFSPVLQMLRCRFLHWFWSHGENKAMETGSTHEWCPVGSSISDHQRKRPRLPAEGAKVPSPPSPKDPAPTAHS